MPEWKVRVAFGSAVQHIYVLARIWAGSDTVPIPMQRPSVVAAAAGDVSARVLAHDRRGVTIAGE